MPHISETVLARYVLDPRLVDNAAAIESHLAVCIECRRTAEAIASFDETLADVDAWTGMREDTASDAFDELRKFAAASAAEDVEAQGLLKEFDDAPAARFAWADLPSSATYHTAGVVRALSKRSEAMCDRDPRFALAIADAAVAIAAQLTEQRYPMSALREWRGEALKRKAYALFNLGRFDSALEALDEAESEYKKLSHASVGYLSVLYARAKVLREQDDLVGAEALAERVASAALHLGATDHYIAARALRGAIHFQKREFDPARAEFRLFMDHGQRTNNSAWMGWGLLNLGLCSLEQGDLAMARSCLNSALQQFTKVELGTEVTRTEWAIARVTFAEGAYVDGIQMLRRVVGDLTKREMLTDAACAAVHLAEMLYSAGRYREIPKVLDGVVQTFTRAGKLTGALAALAYLKESAISGRLTTALTTHVARFLRRAEHQPQLLFAPPPDPV